MARRKNKNGFTIVELLIVIVVIAVLAAITVVGYNGIQQRAKLTQQTAAVAQYAKAFALYTNEKGSAPYSNTTTSANAVACVYPYPDCNDSGRSIALSSELATNIAPYLGSTPAFNEKVAVNFSSLSPTFTGIYFYVIFASANGSCPGISSLSIINKTDFSDGKIACRYAIV